MIHQGVFGAIANSIPVITGGGSAAGVAYTASQTSAYSSSTIGTYANLTDFNGSTGAATDGTGFQRVIATFAEIVEVSAVQVGGGNLPTWGSVSSYLNNRTLQYSNNGTTWINALTFSGVTDSGVNQFVTFTLTSPLTAQYWCILGSGFIATTELKFT